MDLEKIVNFILDIFENLGEIKKEDKKKMLKLAIDEDYYLTKS